MKFIIIAVILAELGVYGSVTGAPGSFDLQYGAVYELPVMPIDPDDDEDDRVRPRKDARWSARYQRTPTAGS